MKNAVCLGVHVYLTLIFVPQARDIGQKKFANLRFPYTFLITRCFSLNIVEFRGKMRRQSGNISFVVVVVIASDQ